MALAHDKYLRLMQNNIHEQFPERYTLRAGETCETHSSVYTRSLESLKPIPKNLVQRTRFCVMMDLAIPCDLPYENVVSDVIVVTMPLSRLPEMAEVAVDHLACEDLLQDLPRVLRKLPNREAAGNEVAQILH